MKVVSFFVDVAVCGSTFGVIQSLTGSAGWGVVASILICMYGLWNFVLSDRW